MSRDMYSDDGLSFTSSIAGSDFAVVDAASRAPTSVEPLQKSLDTDALLISPEAKPQPNRHPMFCFTRDDLVDLEVGLQYPRSECISNAGLKVGGTRFTIHAHLFEGRSDKARAFIEGRRESPDGVIVVDDISAHDFERFLTILYAKYVSTSDSTVHPSHGHRIGHMTRSTCTPKTTGRLFLLNLTAGNLLLSAPGPFESLRA
jgi:hypothetical protein